MWTLFKKDKDDEQIDAIWLELDGKNGPYFVLPIFTNPDDAINFVGDIKIDDGLVQMHKVTTLEDIAKLTVLITSQPASAVVLNSPNLKQLEGSDKDVEVVYWMADEFLYIIDQLLKMANTYEDAKLIETFDRYLKEKSASILDLE